MTYHGGKSHYITDHVGSTRLVVDRFGNIKEQDDYLPYGKKFKDTTLISGKNDYLYGGKESQQFFDIPWYESGARFLSTDGFFTSLDPAAEAAYNISPYAWCNCDPVNHLDMDGNTPDLVWDILNVAMDIKSMSQNIKEGNWVSAAIDGVGLTVDLAAAVVPLVPGGAGAILKTARAADKAADALKASDKAVDAVRASDKAVDAARTSDKGGGFVETFKEYVHGNSKASTKAQHSYDIIDTETGKVVKVGVSGGKVRRDGKSYRAEAQVRAWNKEAGREKYKSRITHWEPAGEGARDRILKYESERAHSFNYDIREYEKHQRP